MTREELEAALAKFDEMGFASSAQGSLSIVAAARKQLSLMAEKCGTCDGGGQVFERGEPFSGSLTRTTCPTCHGSGKVYPQETVDLLTEVWRTLWDRPPYFPWKDLPESHREHLLKEAREAAVAVLDALGETE